MADDNNTGIDWGLAVTLNRYINNMQVAIWLSTRTKPLSYFIYDVDTHTILGLTELGKKVNHELQIPNRLGGADMYYIAPYAFEGAPNRAFTIQSGITSIGEQAFHSCTQIEGLVIPDTVVNYGDYIFKDCVELTYVGLPANKHDIPTGMFYGCHSNYVSNLIPLSNDYSTFDITTIGEYAFYDAGVIHLNRTDIPDTVIYIKKYAFAHDGAGTKVTIANPNCVLEESVFDSCTYLANAKLPVNIGYIPSKLFSECTHLTTVNFNELYSLQEIGDRAFYDNKALNNVTLPHTLKTIGNYTFAYCTSLANFSLNDSLLSIGDYTFYGCRSISDINMPDTVTTMGTNVFSECNKDVDYVGLKTARLSNSITTIPDSTFYNCTSLTTVTISMYALHINLQAFYNCTSLTSINMPETLLSIEEGAFYKCASLYSVTIPKATKYIGKNAFRECTSLTTLILKTDPGMGDFVLGDAAFALCGITSCVLPQNTKSVGDGCFSGNKFPTMIIPSNCNYVGEAAFSNCQQLTNVIIPGTITNIKSMTFYNCISLDSVTIGEGIQSIGYNAFAGCTALTSIALPQSLLTLSSYAFGGCSLTSIAIPPNVIEVAEYFANSNTVMTLTIQSATLTPSENAFTALQKLHTVYCVKGSPSDKRSLYNSSDPLFKILYI